MWQACPKPLWQTISGPVTQINSKILFRNTNAILKRIKADPGPILVSVQCVPRKVYKYGFKKSTFRRLVLAN